MIKQLLIFSFCLTSYGFGVPEESLICPETPAIICSSSNCYTIVGELGRGACGKVLEVCDSNGQLYALKLFSDPVFSADAKRIYELGSTLQHQNIIRSLDYMFDDTSINHPNASIILEFVRGETLNSLPNGTLTPDQAKNLCLQFIDAMRYSLDLGVIHVDMHLENLMIDKDFVLKIIDIDSFFHSDILRAYKDEISGIKNHSFIHSNSETDNKSHEVFSLLASYFDKTITEACMAILCKSNLDRNEKINMRSSIKKLAWEYVEDVEENQSIWIDEYLDHLVALLDGENDSQLSASGTRGK